MFDAKMAVIGTFAVLMMVSLIPSSHAVLWDLITIADVENTPILPGQAPIITGAITDQASNPVELAQVHIRSGQNSVFTITDEQGQFRVVLDEFSKIPGTYTVNIVANAPDGKTGIATTEFQIKGDLAPEAILEQQLSTPEAIKYLQAQQEDFAKDPIGFMLWNHYQELNQKYIEKKKVSEQLAEKDIINQQQKAQAEEFRQQAIKDFNPTIGVFSGYKYDDYVKSLNPEIKDTIVNQLNFTKSVFEEAQLVKQSILEKGGTQEEAMKAYLEKMTITKEDLASFGVNATKIQNNTETEIIPIPDNTIQEIQNMENKTKTTNVNATDIKVNFDGETIFVNINGTIIEFIVNSTGVFQLDK